MAGYDSGLSSLEPPEFHGDAMEVEPAPATELPIANSRPWECTEGSAHLHDTSPVTPNSHKNYSLCLYNSKHIKKQSLADQVQSTMSCMQRYDVSEPIGCVLLLGTDGTPESPHDLTSVGNDLDTIGRTLKDGGWDILYRDSELSGRTLQDVLEYQLGRWSQRLAECSVFMLYYTGHGTAEGIVLNDSELFCYTRIVTKIAEIPCLRQKPKIFIFDSCRKKHTGGDNPGTYITSKTYSQGIKDNHLQYQRNSHDPYPPPHTVICFSASEGQPSFLDKVEGSFYTLALAHALRQFGSEWSFQEIITQVNGGTQEVARFSSVVQNPIFMSNLEKLLVLNTSFGYDSAERGGPNITTTPLSESQERNSKSLVVSVGVVRDRDLVPKDPKVKIAWKSKEEVMSNVGHLGNGVSVFFIYAPSPDNAHKPVLSEDRAELKNRFLMSRLFFDLELHGFHVLSDLHLGNTEPFNWVQWYISRISCCNFVIFVCSPAFKELFETDLQSDKFLNPKAGQLIEYRNAVYAGISNEMSKEGRKKFIPVILDNSYEAQKCVPLLLQPGTVYRVLKEDHRRFDFDNRSRDFEKLVCHMAGINRNDLERLPQVSRVPTLPGPFDRGTGDMWLDDFDEELRVTPPQGYVSAGQPSCQGLVGPPQSAAGGGQSARRVEHHHVGLSPSIVGAHAHVQLPHPLPQQQHHPHPLEPRPLQPPQDSMDSLPTTTPDTRIYLWLSREIASWKFIARELGVRDLDLERITEDHRGTDEQCYQMFLVWAQRFGGNGCDYRTLGRVLQNSDKNRHLCAEYVRRVRELKQLH